MNDADYMLRCLELAEKGKFYTAPNPRVGCVIVSQNKQIIGEGYHERFGGAHAEVNAMQSVRNTDDLQNSTLYVNLEPCSHHGKTPPCTSLIIEKYIPRVVIGMKDPHKKVMGDGIQRLMDVGIDVKVGVEEKACREINKRFICFHETGRPYVILKWAESNDGLIGKLNERTAITSEQTNKLIHQWRAEEQAILIGKNTAVIDNPSLTVRYVEGRNPLRIVLGTEASLPKSLNLLTDGNPTYFLPLHNDSGFDELTTFCQTHQIISILVEGGAFTLQKFIDAGWWHEARVIRNHKLSLENGVQAPVLSDAILNDVIQSGDDIIRIYRL
ncbi:MAG: bifunctional diaminohydroxyphosphoribosylaminopyrimidine deaminase/5-amino-6-(5-phosphoribosylamino)uracil reductase RibD [Flavobacteriales bacterium]|nr:bifunctional diaminohydroxyphosphoribosylaminopyrimidine deaminase/5-amino-6-(5-phosphoribosylamino)uracil reductase RibD [Flavobacteriales bacterium]